MTRSPDERAGTRSRRAHVPAVAPLATIIAAIAGTIAVLASIDPSGAVSERHGLFAVMAIGGALAVMALAVVLLAAADRAECAEAGFAGTGVLAMAVLLLVNGTLTPDVFYDPSPGFPVAFTLAGPAFVAGALPLVARRTRFATWAARRWRDWSLLTVLGAFVLAFGLAGLPELVDLPDGRHPVNVAIAVVAGVAIGVVAVRFAERRGARVPGAAAAWWSLAALAVAAAGLPVAEPFALGSWVLRAVAAAGGAGVALSGLLLVRAVRHSQRAFAPVLAVDPLLGVDLACSPAVARLTAADAFGPDAVDEVVRTAGLAIDVARQLRLPPEECRRIGMAAVLHDVGKATVPREIVDKPGRLTPDERARMQSHTVTGEQIVLADPLLAELAPIVRGHHERVDGSGYPDGLAADAIPIGARVIAVCDAFDAMTHDRPYRAGLNAGTALAVLREHAGRQWDADVVRAVTLVVAGRPDRLERADRLTLDALGGHGHGLPGRPAGKLRADLPADLPADLGDLLASVDHEI